MDTEDSVSKHGYLVRPSITGEGDQFCGRNLAKHGVCPNCDRPLLHIMTLRNTPFSLGVPSVGLYYCWRCNIAQSPFFYRVLDNDIEVLSFGSGGIQDNFPYEGYPDQFPEVSVSYIRMPVDEVVAIEELNAGVRTPYSIFTSRPELLSPRSQLGGIFYEMQDVDVMHCCNCNAPMRFLALIGDDTFTEDKFTNNPEVGVMYFICVHCAIVGATQKVD